MGFTVFHSISSFEKFARFSGNPIKLNGYIYDTNTSNLLDKLNHKIQENVVVIKFHSKLAQELITFPQMQMQMQLQSWERLKLLRADY